MNLKLNDRVRVRYDSGEVFEGVVRGQPEVSSYIVVSDDGRALQLDTANQIDYTSGTPFRLEYVGEQSMKLTPQNLIGLRLLEDFNSLPRNSIVSFDSFTPTHLVVVTDSGDKVALPRTASLALHSGYEDFASRVEQFLEAGISHDDIVAEIGAVLSPEAARMLLDRVLQRHASFSGVRPDVLRFASGVQLNTKFALSYEERIAGLQKYSSWDVDNALLFPFESPTNAHFWAAQVKFPFDLVFCTGGSKYGAPQAHKLLREYTSWATDMGEPEDTSTLEFFLRAKQASTPKAWKVQARRLFSEGPSEYTIAKIVHAISPGDSSTYSHPETTLVFETAADVCFRAQAKCGQQIFLEA